MFDAALSLFMDQGYDDMTIQQVATAAGVAPASSADSVPQGG
jgi:AcrR family transcriptional regulator